MTFPLVEQAHRDGVTLSLTPRASIIATGNREAVARWVPTIRLHKTALIEYLSAAMTPPEETALVRWLEHIGERDPEIIAGLFKQCRTDSSALAYFLALAKSLPAAGPVRCGDCISFSRTNHPHLGHCGRGEPEAIAGLWDTDQRYCDQYKPK